ncbi:MAG: histidine kinase [Nitrospirae bacterium]|nr:histidine kinase [Nitrospirota bacterium]
MKEGRETTGGIEYVVGAEKGIREIVRDEDVMPLLESALSAGASRVEVTDSRGGTLWACGASSGNNDSATVERRPVFLEGEPAGSLVVEASPGSQLRLNDLAGLLCAALNKIITNSLKRMLTTEIHTSVVNRTYEELLETNKRLRASESRYRELAENLDRKVQERTEELKRMHTRLIQQEKAASIGLLAAGVAHEINNPIGFISSNLNTLKRYISRFTEMMDFYRAAIEEADKAGGGITEAACRKWSDLKLDFIVRDVEELISQSLDGAERVRKIVSDLKGFSHVDDSKEDIVDLNTEIERTFNVLVHEIPEDAEIVKEFGSLPGFLCNPAMICQVFLNIILNSLQARRQGLKLHVSTKHVDGNITVAFSDNGPGIPEEVRNRIFEPFFTTKDVGAGTGLGLTVTLDIVTAYGGDIEVTSCPGKGTTFVIRLPAERREHVKVR